jgi:adenylate kinase
MILLVGAPGSGKGTQGDLLCSVDPSLVKISTGDLLRKHIKEATDLGKRVEATLVAGHLVSDDILLQLLGEELKELSGGKNLLLDGYPRNLKQAQDLEALVKVDAVIYLRVGLSNLLERIMGRQVCSNCGKAFHRSFSPSKQGEFCDACGGSLKQRPDDTQEKLEVRYRVYEQETVPVLEFYRQRGLLREVDGEASLASVATEMETLLHEIRK